MGAEATRIVVGVSGGIAAYKAVELVRELQRAGSEVRVVMTESAARFVGPMTFTGLIGQPTVTTLWDPGFAGEVHVALGQWAQAMVIAPATMNTIARFAHGLADDVVLATAACVAGPVLLAPAMHERMWEQSSTQANVDLLRKRGVLFSGPVRGPLADGSEGVGRMSEPSEILGALRDAIKVTHDLSGLGIVVTAGPTFEDVDPVRFIGNRSSGTMGYAIARAAARRGARVTLISGPVALEPPAGVEVARVRTAAEMQAAVREEQARADVIVMAAAVADYRPATYSRDKLKKTETKWTLELEANPDILAGLGRDRGASKRPVLIGFALETEDLVSHARHKILSKRADLIVANAAEDALGSADNRAILVTAEGSDPLPRMPKHQLADRILDWLSARVPVNDDAVELARPIDRA